MFCPLQVDQLDSIVGSGWVHPFPWKENCGEFWNKENVVFFDRPYKHSNGNTSGIWLFAEGKVLSSWPGSRITMNENNWAFSFESGIPVVPGIMKISVETLEQREFVLDRLTANDVFSKWSSKCIEDFVQIETSPICAWNFLKIERSSLCHDETTKQRFDRQRGVVLQDLLLSTDSYKSEERYWAKFLDHLQILRDNKKLLVDEDSTELREAKKVLQKATGGKTESFHLNMIRAEIAKHRLTDCEKAIHQFLRQVLGINRFTSDLPDFIYTVLYKSLPEESRRKTNLNVRNWLAQQNSTDVWTLVARMQKNPYDPVIHGDISNVVKTKVSAEKIPFIEECLLKQPQWSCDFSTFASVVVDTLLDNTTNPSGIDLLRKGMSSSHRSEIIETVIKMATENSVKQDIIKSLNEIQEAEKGSFGKYTIQQPIYDVEVNSFLVFLMSPMDAKRIREQCGAWRNCDVRLSLVFHAALLGYGYLAGISFQPFWDAIRKNPLLGEKISLFLFELQKSVQGSSMVSELTGESGKEVAVDPVANLRISAEDPGLNREEKLLPEANVDILILIKKSKDGMTLAALKKHTFISDEMLIEKLEQLAGSGSISRPEGRKKSWNYIHESRS